MSTTSFSEAREAKFTGANLQMVVAWGVNPMKDDKGSLDIKGLDS